MVEAGANVQLVERVYEAFTLEDLDAAVALTHTDVEIDERAALPGGRLYRGRDGVREWLGELVERWSDLKLEVQNLEAREDRVLATLNISAHGASTGATVQGQASHVWQIQDAHLRRLEVFYDHRAARAAAGLAQAPHPR